MTELPPAPNSPEDGSYNPIFERLAIGPDGQTSLPGLIAYGLYKVSKREWVGDFRARHGRKPNDSELDGYTRTWTPSQLTTVRERAAQVLSEYASTVIEQEEPRILRDALRGSFWRSVWPSMVGALFYTLVLIAVAFILTWAGIDILGIFGRIGPG